MSDQVTGITEAPVEGEKVAASKTISGTTASKEWNNILKLEREKRAAVKALAEQKAKLQGSVDIVSELKADPVKTLDKIGVPWQKLAEQKLASKTPSKTPEQIKIEELEKRLVEFEAKTQKEKEETIKAQETVSEEEDKQIIENWHKESVEQLTKEKEKYPYLSAMGHIPLVSKRVQEAFENGESIALEDMAESMNNTLKESIPTELKKLMGWSEIRDIVKEVLKEYESKVSTSEPRKTTVLRTGIAQLSPVTKQTIVPGQKKTADSEWVALRAKYAGK